MDEKPNQPTTVEAYIAGFPPEVQAILTRLRETIRSAAPDAEERIAYAMPSYYLNGPLVYFAAFKKHVGFYAAGASMDAFKDEVAPYKQSKGTIQFPLNQPIPYDLIARMTEYRAAQNRQKPAQKKRAPKAPPEEAKTGE